MRLPYFAQSVTHRRRLATMSRALCLLSVTVSTAGEATCGMAFAFNQVDRDGGSAVAVWKATTTPSLFFADAMNVNTDGTRRSYSVEDFWGETRALNNLCNAMSDKCAGLDEPGLRARRILTQRAHGLGWPKDMLQQTKISSSIIPFIDGKPCPEVGGYLVSATALHKRGVQNPCDIGNYADALTIPAIVVPGRGGKGRPPTAFENSGVRVGDLVVAMSGDGEKIVYSVVGDTGPAKQIGEVSIALAGRLLGKAVEPASYREIRGKRPFSARQAWTVDRAFILIFPRTKSSTDPYMTKERIDRDAAAAFNRWGGAERLRACRSEYRQR